MNYKNEFKKVLDNFKTHSDRPECHTQFAIWVINKMLDQRYESEYKKHNFDPIKSNDKFIAKKNLEYLEVYIEELFLLDKTLDIEPDQTNWLSIRKEMRRVLHELYKIV